MPSTVTSSIGAKSPYSASAAEQAPPLPVDHTATMELLNHPDEWTVLYERMPLAGIAFTRDRERALRVPVSAVVRSPGAHSEIVDDLIATLQAVHRRTGDEA